MLVLIVLSSCAIISHQQMLPDYGRRGLFWLPYLLPSRHFNHNQPVHYEYHEDAVFHDSQTLPELSEQPEVIITQLTYPECSNEQSTNLDQSLFGGVEGRNNHKKNNVMDGTLDNDDTGIQMRMNKPDARLFLFSVDSTFDNPFWKTVTLTITSTVDVTSAQLCIPQEQFSAGSSTVACRRKKRVILQDSLNVPEDTQFGIHPSKPLPLTTTNFATISPLDDIHDVDDDDMITSSKNDLITNDEATDRQHRSFRNMRFYVKNLASVTVYSYVFNSFVSTRTISLVSTGGGFFNVVRLVCLPDGYIVC